MEKTPITPPAGKKRIFRPTRKCPKTGRVLRAREFGLKAWAIDVPEETE